MAYARFDDATKSVVQAPRKLYPAIPVESIRRAIQSMTNRVVSGTNGTMGGTAGIGASWFSTGSTAGIRFLTALTLCVNGRVGTANAVDNIFLPKGTQSSNTWVKYMIATKFGDSATCVAGNEGASSTAARLPDCPDGYVAVGYVEYNTTSGKYARFGGGTAGAYNVMSGNAAATCGTCCGTGCFLNMPYDET
jgi:hypothetical protein